MSKQGSTRKQTFLQSAKQMLHTFARTTKKVISFIFSQVVARIALVGLVAIPFLHGVLSKPWACAIWVACSVVFIIDSIVIWHKQRKSNKPESTWHIFSQGFSFTFLLFSSSFFVANHFDTVFTWQWALALFCTVTCPICCFNSWKYLNLKNQYSETQAKRIKNNLLKIVLFYWLIIGFFISVYLKSLIWQYITGGFGLVIIFVNLSEIVLSGNIPHKLLTVHDLLAGVALTVYLIYVIPNPSIQNIILVITAALYGGLMTLVGVAWTIKDGQRKDLESKRLEKIPYLQASIGKWIVKEKRESLLPDLLLNLTRSDNENFVSSGFSIEITNIGLGLADNLKCTWQSGDISNHHSFSHSLLQCNQSFSINAIISAARKAEQTCMDAALIFEFDDLLENHYSQTLNISFQVGCGYIKPETYKMNAPVYIGRSQEVKNA